MTLAIDSFADSFTEKHGKTLIVWLVIGIGAWFTLEAKVENVMRDKADRVEVQEMKNEIRLMADDLNTVVQYICQSQASSLGCQRRDRR